MATLPSEFIELAAELIGDEFAAFASDCVITKLGAFDPEAQAASSVVTTIPMIRIDFKESSYSGDNVKVGDYMLIGEYQKLGFLPSPDNCAAVHDGITSNVTDVQTDPAKATVILHLRRA